jgi:glycosyltransferase involved in cell wall biosynthesis
MRVVHVHRVRGIGGSERHVLALLPALAQLGIEPLFVGLDDPASSAEPFYGVLDEARVPYVRLRSRRDLDPPLALSLRRALRRLRPDIVHTHLVHADVYGALAAPGPLISTKHNDDRFRRGPYRFVERAVTRRAERVIAITRALARFNVEEVGLPAEKIDVVHYGLDAPPQAWGTNPPAPVARQARVLLAVARLVEQKGIDRAVRALPQIRANAPDAVLVVLGEGPDRPRLEALARDLGVGDAVFLLGRVPDVAAWLQRAEVLVHPARWEGFGLALLEAMLASLPIVATKVSAIPELVVDGETGLLADEAALAPAVSSLLADRALAAKLGHAGLARARKAFSVERMARRTAAVYRAGGASKTA